MEWCAIGIIHTQRNFVSNSSESNPFEYTDVIVRTDITGVVIIVYVDFYDCNFCIEG